MDVDFDMVLRFAKTLEGRDVYTQSRRAPFRVRVVSDLLEFVPQSTGKVRRQGKTLRDGQQLLDRYNLTRSLWPGDYHNIARNSSYLLTLITMMVGSENRSRRGAAGASSTRTT